jgi:hypothetical protein
MLTNRAVPLDDSIIPQRTSLKALCGWRFNKVGNGQGLADGIVVGPALTNTKSNIDRSLLEKWAKDAPRMTSLWSNKVRRRLPKLLVVLEEWTSPTWTYIMSDEDEVDPGSSAVGLVSSADGATPEWQYLALPEEMLTAWGRFGNTAVLLPYCVEC